MELFSLKLCVKIKERIDRVMIVNMYSYDFESWYNIKSWSFLTGALKPRNDMLCFQQMAIPISIHYLDRRIHCHFCPFNWNVTNNFHEAHCDFRVRSNVCVDSWLCEYQLGGCEDERLSRPHTVPPRHRPDTPLKEPESGFWTFYCILKGDLLHILRKYFELVVEK